jgi:hypothetical protein
VVREPVSGAKRARHIGPSPRTCAASPNWWHGRHLQNYSNGARVVYPKNSEDLRAINLTLQQDILGELLEEDALDQERHDALMAGKQMSGSERQLLRTGILRRHFSEPDADVCSAICFCRAPSDFRDKRVLIILSKGYSFTEVRREIFGAFPTQKATLAALRSQYVLASDVCESEQ